MKLLSKHKTHILVFFLCSITTVYVYRSLLFNLSTHLLDWFDYPYYVWTIFHNIHRITSLNFESYFTTPAFHGYESTLLFSDMLLPQSLIGVIFSLFTENHILVFNLVFFSTLLLNIVAIQYFWSAFFKKPHSYLFAVFTTALGPFLFIQGGHFQMISYWLLFLALGVFFKYKTVRSSLIVGLLLTLQFLASVYLAVFGIAILGISFSAELFDTVLNNKKNNLYNSIVMLIIVAISFGVTVAPLALKYKQTQSAYGMQRSYGEYVFYAAQPSDYLFTNTLKSYGSTNPAIKKWNSYNQHSSGEIATGIGVTLTILTIIGLFVYKKKKNSFDISLLTSQQHLTFFFFLTCGFVFSLGPQLSINGTYINIPLPYAILMKVVPLFEPIRATGRWSFLFYIAIAYFSAKGLEKICKNKINSIALSSVFILLAMFTYEMLPTQKTASQVMYYHKAYEAIEPHCEENYQVLLEYPINQTAPDVNIATNLSYKTQMLLAQLNHGCKIVNGYAGYDPLDLGRFEKELELAISEQNSASISALLQEKNVSLVKVNIKDASSESAQRAKTALENMSPFALEYEDSTSAVFIGILKSN